MALLAFTANVDTATTLAVTRFPCSSTSCPLSLSRSAPGPLATVEAAAVAPLILPASSSALCTAADGALAPGAGAGPGGAFAALSFSASSMAFVAAAFALASFSATDGAGFSAAGSSVAGASFDASAAAPASAFASSAESHRRRLDLRAPSSGAVSASSALRFSALPPAIAPARANPSAEAVT